MQVALPDAVVADRHRLRAVPVHQKRQQQNAGHQGVDPLRLIEQNQVHGGFVVSAQILRQFLQLFPSEGAAALRQIAQLRAQPQGGPDGAANADDLLLSGDINAVFKGFADGFSDPVLGILSGQDLLHAVPVQFQRTYRHRTGFFQPPAGKLRHFCFAGRGRAAAGPP